MAKTYAVSVVVLVGDPVVDSVYVFTGPDCKRVMKKAEKCFRGWAKWMSLNTQLDDCDDEFGDGSYVCNEDGGVYVCLPLIEKVK